MLQSYFDGELSTQEMDSTTLHLASCATCSAAAHELEQETSLLTTALAVDFEANVPTERLRLRIDAAISGLAAVRTAPEKTGLAAFFRSLSGLLALTPQRTLGYASLIVVLAFAGIFGVVKFRNAANPGSVPAKDNYVAELTPAETALPPAEIETQEKPTPRRVVRTRSSRISHAATPRPVPVKLIPGESTYLQTIARLDSTIKSGKQSMRPALQVEYERNLAVVDRAIAATRTAAKSNPNDPDAADFMFAAYQSKVDLLNTIADARVGGRSH
jgi:anti-sigma factor RsiW